MSWVVLSVRNGIMLAVIGLARSVVGVSLLSPWFIAGTLVVAVGILIAALRPRHRNMGWSLMVGGWICATWELFAFRF